MRAKKTKWQQIRAYFDDFVAERVRGHSLPILRVCLGVVYLWFGLLKVFNVSPIAYIIESTYTFLPFPLAIILLGVWELLIGIGLILKKLIRTTIVFLWLQMIGILGCAFIAPSIFFESNPLILTLEGEFLVKNVIVIAASIVIVGYKTHPVEKV